MKALCLVLRDNSTVTESFSFVKKNRIKALQCKDFLEIKKLELSLNYQDKDSAGGRSLLCKKRMSFPNDKKYPKK
jgi:hypothetical protein